MMLIIGPISIFPQKRRHDKLTQTMSRLHRSLSQSPVVHNACPGFVSNSELLANEQSSWLLTGRLEPSRWNGIPLRGGET